MSYTPEKSPTPNAWAEREFTKISNELNGPLKLNVMNRAPERPRDGWIVVADGTNWDPGSGAGVYVYLSGWVKL